jgi:hypothetical protein
MGTKETLGRGDIQFMVPTTRPPDDVSFTLSRLLVEGFIIKNTIFMTHHHFALFKYG